MIKTCNKVEIEGNVLHLINSIYEKPAANIILYGDKRRMSLLPPLFDIVLRFSPGKLGNKMKLKGIQLGSKK